MTADLLATIHFEKVSPAYEEVVYYLQPPLRATDLRGRIAERLDQLLASIAWFYNERPDTDLAPVPGDFHGPLGWPVDAAPKAWPEGLPWPLTARQALEHLRAAQSDAVAWIEADIRAAVAWLVAPELVDDVLALPELVDGWRWPWLTAPIGNGPEWCGPSYGWRLALGRLSRRWGDDLPPADAGRWPDPGLTHREVAAWAQPTLNLRHPAVPYDPRSAPGARGAAHGQKLWDGSGELSEEVAAAAYGLTLDEWRKEYPGKPALGDDLVAEVESWGEIRRELVVWRADRLPAKVHRTTLALLYLVERRARESLPGELLAAALAAVRAWSSDAPGDVHNAAARGALEVESGPADAVELLARELWRECKDLVERLSESAKPAGLGEVPELRGLMAMDAELAAWLAERDPDKAQDLKEAAGERLAKWRAGEPGAARELFARWLDERALRLVAGALWRESQKPSLRIRGVSKHGDIYSTAPRLVAPMAWAFGGAGKAAPVIDGDQYGETPAVARYLPRVATMRDLRNRPPAQRALPVEVDAPAELQVVADAQFVVNPFTAKVALAMLTLAPVDGGLASGELDELCRTVLPDGRIQGRDLERMAQALRDLRSLALVLTDDTAVTLFNDIRGPATPGAAKKKHRVSWSLSRLTQQVSGPGGEWPGRFLFNFSGAMRLSAHTESAHLRAYLVCAALWNGARPGGELDPACIPALDVTGWADRFNLLTPAALESKSPAHRVRLSKDHKATRETLESLADEHGLLTLEKVGRDTLRPLPTAALLEAYRATRAHGSRLHKVG